MDLVLNFLTENLTAILSIIAGLGVAKLGTVWALLPALAKDIQVYRAATADGKWTNAEKIEMFDRIMVRIETIMSVLKGITPFKTKV